MTRIKRGVSLYSYQHEYAHGTFTLEDCVAAAAEVGALDIETAWLENIYYRSSPTISPSDTAPYSIRARVRPQNRIRQKAYAKTDNFRTYSILGVYLF